MPGINFFFYGTLRDPDVRRAVLGPHAAKSESLPAALHGFRCAPVGRGRFPALVPEAAAVADGVLIGPVSLGAAARVSHFEGEGYDYDVALHDIALPGGSPRSAWVYMPGDGLAVQAGHWSLEAWRGRHKTAFLRSAEHAMRACGAADIAEAEAAWRRRTSQT